MAAPAKFLGAQTCSSSSCHGGGGNNQDQFTRWSRFDVHHERPVALLETRRSEVIAETLKIADPTRNDRCTVCHAPLETVPVQQLGPEVKTIEGVSCENCHAPAENWLRPHTRTDWTTADRVCAGMRDLRNLYVRANTCVACHQNIDPDLARAGHPELIFEMDGQSAAEPRHWRTNQDKPGPQIWLVGQAVALREMSWQLAREGGSDAALRPRWEGLQWLVQTVNSIDNSLPRLDAAAENPWTTAQQWSDALAKAAANMAWSGGLSRQCLLTLADTGAAFADKKISREVQARRAERLVLALDRLVDGAKNMRSNKALNRSLNRLFADAQSLPDFDPAQFSAHLNEFHQILAEASK